MGKRNEALIAKWEARLRSEGMPDEFHTSRRQALSDVSVSTPDGGGISASSTYQHWTKLTHAAYALPRNYKSRSFLLTYVECGYLQRACNEHGMTVHEGRKALARFAETMRKSNEPTE